MTKLAIVLCLNFFCCSVFGATPVPPPLPAFPDSLKQSTPRAGTPSGIWFTGVRKCEVPAKFIKIPTMKAEGGELRANLPKGWQVCKNLIVSDEWIGHRMEKDSLVIEIHENDTVEIRQGSLEIHGGGSSKIEIQIKQEAYSDAFFKVN